MQIIKSIDKTFLDMYGYQFYNKSNSYILSKYVIKHEYKKLNLMFNFLTSEFIVTEINEPISEDFLVTHWFKIDSKLDQTTIASILKRKRNNIAYYTPNKDNRVVIFTTLDCNARCPYCFELGRNKISMTSETADKVADFMMERGNSYRIGWFGGEPLYNPKVIRTITNKLRNNHILFESNFTTNGLLFNNFSLYELKYLWNTKDVQITLDGTENVYNNIKNFITDKNNAFKRVLDNIFFLNENGIKVNIRYNISLDNVEDIICLIDQIVSDSRYTNDITMYACRLMREKSFTKEDEEKLCENDNYVNKYIIEKIGNIQNRSLFLNWRDYYCWAQSGSTPVITPEGYIGRCEHYSNKEDQLYSIYNKNIKIKDIEKFTISRNISNCKNCESCPLYPSCTLTNICEMLIPCDDIGMKFYIEKAKLSMEYYLDKYIKRTSDENIS